MRKFKEMNSGVKSCLNGLHRTRKYSRVCRGYIEITKKGTFKKASLKDAKDDE